MSYPILYLVMAYQYGCEQGHIYPVGVYRTKEAARHNARKEYFNRGSKYSVKMFETRHPNKSNPNRLKPIYHLISHYKGKLKSFSQT